MNRDIIGDLAAPGEVAQHTERWRRRIPTVLVTAVCAAALLAQPTPVAAIETDTLTVRTLVGPIEAGTGGLEVDELGNIYTSDFGATLSSGPVGKNVWKVSPGGDVTLFATGFVGASGNIIGPDGWFYQSNVAGGSVSRVSPDGVVEHYSASGGNSPVGLVFTPSGDLLVANCSSNLIAKIDSDRTVTSWVESSLLRCPNGITRAPDGNYYVANFGNGDVVRISPKGVAEVLVTLPGNNNGHLVFGNDVLYVVARGNHQIFEVTLEGEIRLIVGSGVRGLDDGAANEASLSLPNDLALSPDGSILYWNDTGVTDPSDSQTLTPTYIRYVDLRDGKAR